MKNCGCKLQGATLRRRTGRVNKQIARTRFSRKSGMSGNKPDKNSSLNYSQNKNSLKNSKTRYQACNPTPRLTNIQQTAKQSTTFASGSHSSKTSSAKNRNRSNDSKQPKEETKIPLHPARYSSCKHNTTDSCSP